MYVIKKEIQWTVHVLFVQFESQGELQGELCNQAVASACKQQLIASIFIILLSNISIMYLSF